jgi:serine/threonine-protein kinase HipA
MSYLTPVFYGQKAVGQLQLDRSTGLPQLDYHQLWQQEGFPLSPALFLHQPHHPTSLYNYLDNLLPEGEARRLLAQNIGVSEKQVYPQIRELGQDLSGAFVFGDATSQQAKPSFRPISSAEMLLRLEQKEDVGLLMWDEKPRLSVAGVQDKLNVFVAPDGQIGFGDGSLCSTHLLKFERKNCPHLVLNEFFCMKLAEKVGLAVAPVQFMRFGYHPALLVKRFDRKYDPRAGRVLRQHVIDGCQALDLPRDYKYERNLGDGRDVAHIRDGASLSKLFEFCRQTPTSAENSLWLLNWQLFNLMISNYDSHAKNLSFHYGKLGSQKVSGVATQRCQFTQSYDLVNVGMFEQFKHSLAMAMGDEFEPGSIHVYQLADFAETCGLDKKLVARTLSTLSKNVLRELDTLDADALITGDAVLNAGERDYWQLLRQHIKDRTTYLAAQAQDIPGIVV